MRDDVRAVLVSVAVQLGPERMPYILHTLRSALPDRGYTSHVIGEGFFLTGGTPACHTRGEVGVGGGLPAVVYTSHVTGKGRL